MLPLLLVAASFALGWLLLHAESETAVRIAFPPAAADDAEDDAGEGAGDGAEAPSRPGAGRLLPAAELAGVRRLRVEGIVTLALTLGTPDAALATAEGDAAGVSLRLDEDGRRLTVAGPHRTRLFANEEAPHLSLALPALARLDIDGASRIRLSGPVGDLAITIDGAADVTAAGPRCEALALDVDGAALVDAADLPCARVRIAVDGAARVTAYAKTAAEVGLDGIGAITVRGRPQDVRVSKDGIGRIRFPDRDAPPS